MRKAGEPQSRGTVCRARHRKATRLTHVKKGDSHPPGAPIFVPGLHGIGLLLAGRADRQGPALLAALRWWTSRGPLASHEKDENCKLLRLVSQRWGRSLLHVFDRGYCGSPWLGALRGFQVRFILRWKTNYQLLDATGSKQAAWKVVLAYARRWQSAMAFRTCQTLAGLSVLVCAPRGFAPLSPALALHPSSHLPALLGFLFSAGLFFPSGRHPGN